MLSLVGIATGVVAMWAVITKIGERASERGERRILEFWGKHDYINTTEAIITADGDVFLSPSRLPEAEAEKYLARGDTILEVTMLSGLLQDLNLWSRSTGRDIKSIRLFPVVKGR